MDYCNSLLFGSTHDATSNLQQAQKCAGLVILRLQKSANITIHLKSLHWLLVKIRNTYKITCMCYHCHNSTAPLYGADVVQEKPSHSRNTRSSSHIMPLLSKPALSRSTLGDHSFLYPLSGTPFKMMLEAPIRHKGKNDQIF